MSLEEVLKIIGSLIVVVGGISWIAIKNSIFGIKLWGKDLKKDSSKIKEETIISDDNSYQILSNRVNSLTDKVLMLQDNQIEYSKQIHSLNQEIVNLKQDKITYKRAFNEIIENCDTFCLEETGDCKTVVDKILKQLKINLDDIC